MSAPLQDRRVRIDLSGDFSATELDEIIRELAKRRASLPDAVPRELSPEMAVLEQENPLHIFRTLANGGVRIWLRHEGFGWIPFSLGPQERAGIAEFLGKKPGHTHTAH